MDPIIVFLIEFIYNDLEEAVTSFLIVDAGKAKNAYFKLGVFK